MDNEERNEEVSCEAFNQEVKEIRNLCEYIETHTRIARELCDLGYVDISSKVLRILAENL